MAHLLGNAQKLVIPLKRTFDGLFAGKIFLSNKNVDLLMNAFKFLDSLDSAIVLKGIFN